MADNYLNLSHKYATKGSPSLGGLKSMLGGGLSGAIGGGPQVDPSSVTPATTFTPGPSAPNGRTSPWITDTGGPDATAAGGQPLTSPNGLPMMPTYKQPNWFSRIMQPQLAGQVLTANTAANQANLASATQLANTGLLNQGQLAGITTQGQQTRLTSKQAQDAAAALSKQEAGQRLSQSEQDTINTITMGNAASANRQGMFPSVGPQTMANAQFPNILPTTKLANINANQGIQNDLEVKQALGGPQGPMVAAATSGAQADTAQNINRMNMAPFNLLSGTTGVAVPNGGGLNINPVINPMFSAFAGQGGSIPAPRATTVSGPASMPNADAFRVTNPTSQATSTTPMVSPTEIGQGGVGSAATPPMASPLTSPMPTGINSRPDLYNYFMGRNPQMRLPTEQDLMQIAQ